MARACCGQFALPRVCVTTRGADDRGIVCSNTRSTQCRGRSRRAPPRKRVATPTVHNTRAPTTWRAHA
eukprot:458468-Lingulodinium_polyedra.AAC.1